MAQYTYEAIDIHGSKRKGSMTADRKAIVVEKLKERKLKPLTVMEAPETLANKEITLFQPKVKGKDLVFYLTQFSTLINAGITVVEAHVMLSEQAANKTMKETLEEVTRDLEAGHTISDAYRKFPNVFPQMLTSVIRAAETSGTLEATLKRMAIFFEKKERSRSKVVSAMIYPAILMLLSIAVVIFLMVYIVPMFVQLFEDLQGDLPLITVITKGISDFLRTKGWILGVGIAAIILLYNIALRDPRFRAQMDVVKLKLPALGILQQKNNISIIMSTLASLLSSSVPVVKAISMTQDTVDNIYMKEILMKTQLEVEKGNSINTVFKESWAFPPLVTQMLEVGETTGTLESMLQKLSEIYEEEVDVASDRLKTVLEPMIILFIAVIVGFVVAAIMLPMFSLYTEMQG